MNSDLSSSKSKGEKRGGGGGGGGRLAEEAWISFLERECLPSL